MPSRTTHTEDRTVRTKADGNERVSRLALGSMPRRVRVPYVGSVRTPTTNTGWGIVTHSASLNLGDDFTMVANIATTKQGYIFAKNAGNALSTIEYGLYLSGNGDVQVYLNGINRYTSPTTVVPPEDRASEWRQVVVTYSKTEQLIRVYTEGSLAGSGAYSASIAPTEYDLNLFRRHNAFYLCDSNFAGIRLYNRSFTTEEVEQLYLTNTTPYDNTEHCVLHLETLDGRIDGTTWIDASPAGNNCTLTTGCTVSNDAPSKARTVRE